MVSEGRAISADMRWIWNQHGGSVFILTPLSLGVQGDQGTEGRTADVTQRAKSWAQAAMPKSEAEG